jgi:hypothetical protein
VSHVKSKEPAFLEAKQNKLTKSQSEV